MRQAQTEYKEIQQTFVIKNALKVNPDIFTARNIIDHIEADCKNSISALLSLRYKGQDLVSLFQTLKPLVNRYQKKTGLGTTLNEDELKAL
jgi:hypothetical protein